MQKLSIPFHSSNDQPQFPTTPSTYQVNLQSLYQNEAAHRWHLKSIFISDEQTSPPNLVSILLSCEVLHGWILKTVELKGIPTHKGCKCKGFCSEMKLGGEICPSYEIMHNGQ